MTILSRIGAWIKQATGQGKSFPEPVVIARAQHCISRSQISPNALKVLYRLKEAGFSAFLVGGGVRDLLLDAHPKDFDVATDARPEQVRNLFKTCILIGRRFRLAHVRFRDEIIEVATFRTEAKQNRFSNKQPGMILRDNRYGTIVEDAWRRDFTVNALYYNIADFSVVDFTGGMADLMARQLRMIGNPEQRYREDPVRMLRAIRFAGKLNFSLHEDTRAPLVRLSPLLEWVPPARLFEEFLKLFFHGQSQRTMELLLEYQQFQFLFPSAFATMQNNPTAQKLIDLTLISTDQRINEGKTVTPAFLIAALLWVPVQNSTREFRSEGEHMPRAQQLAMEHVLKKQNQHLSLPKRFTLTTQEIWRLQSRMERRVHYQIHSLLTSNKFRAAYDFLVLRSQAGEDVHEAAQWWAEFQTLDGEQQQAKIDALAVEKQKQPHKKRSRKRRPQQQVKTHD